MNIAKKINLIKKENKNLSIAALINLVARLVSREAGGMDMRAATAFAASQVGTTTKSLMVK